MGYAKRERYLQQLGDLAATTIMNWHKLGGEWVDWRGDSQYEIARWQPCHNGGQALRLVSKVLEIADARMRAAWSFRLSHKVLYWGADFAYYSEETGSFDAMSFPVAVTRATIAESGGELPEHIEGFLGHVED